MLLVPGGAALATLHPASPCAPGAQGMCYADFPISMIDLILDDSVPKCLCEIISLATEQLLNTRNC